MKVFAIGDLHLSGNPPSKPMTIFGPHWEDHWNRIRQDWLRRVSSEDIVCIVGDTSWAMRLPEAAFDLKEITALPGHKYIIRGNHDYWWSSITKMNTLLENELLFLQGRSTSMAVYEKREGCPLSNDSSHNNKALKDRDGNDHKDSDIDSHKNRDSTPHIYTEYSPLENTLISIGGTRGFLCPNDSAFKESTDRSIYERELLRTEAALQEMVAMEHEHPHLQKMRILLLHYPPFNDKNEESGFTKLLERYEVDHCIFGHLHDKISFQRIPSFFGSTQLHLVSADAANFQLQQIL